MIDVRRKRVKSACEVGDIPSLSMALADLEHIEGESDIPTREWFKEEIKRLRERDRIEEGKRAESFGVELLSRLGIDPSIITGNSK